MDKRNLRNREELRARFRDGDRPNGQDFSNLIDSSVNQESDGIFTLDGHLGIGTEIPRAMVDIQNNSNVPSLMASREGSSVFRVTHQGPSVVALSAQQGQSLRLGQYNVNNQNVRPTIQLSPQGNVGIGTHAPRTRLDVAGSARISEQLLLGGGTLRLDAKKGLMINLNGNNYRVLVEKEKPPKPPVDLKWFYVTVIFLLTCIIILLIFKLF